MLQTPPAQPGMREDEIDTPALILDLDAFEANLDRMAALLAPTGARLRAHAERHPDHSCLAWKRAFDYDLYHWELEHFIEYGLLGRGAAPSEASAETYR